MRRIRWVAAPGAIAALLIAGTASAGTFFDNQYQGRAQKDSSTYVGFDLNGSKTKVKKLKTRLAFHCPGNSGADTVLGSSKATIAIDSKGRFSDKVDGDLVLRGTARGGSENVVYKISGKLLKKGKAEGTIEASVRTPARGGTTVRCYTGELDWKAKRGAQITPQDREVGR